MRRLPPLSAYRAFEAAARHVSFIDAARELNVTRSAVSHQIRALEEYLGVALFRRLPGGIELTADAEKLLPEASQALNLIADSTRNVTGLKQSVYLHCSTSFALQWASRHIARFESAHPNILIRLTTDSVIGRSTADHVDLVIEYRDGSDKSSAEDVLLPELLLPVCAPDFLAGDRLSPTALLQKRLLTNSPNGWDWLQWCKSHDVPAEMAAESLEVAMTFDVDAAAIHAASNGMGIALANLCYVKPELDRGILVPATNAKPFELGYHRIEKRVNLKCEQQKFVDWLKDCARETLIEVRHWHDQAAA